MVQQYEVTAYADGICQMFEKLGAPDHVRRELAGLVLACDGAHVAAFGYGVEWRVEKNEYGWRVSGVFNATNITFSREL